MAVLGDEGKPFARGRATVIGCGVPTSLDPTPADGAGTVGAGVAAQRDEGRRAVRRQADAGAVEPDPPVVPDDDGVVEVVLDDPDDESDDDELEPESEDEDDAASDDPEEPDEDEPDDDDPELRVSVL
jgi:hypothetical protein